MKSVECLRVKSRNDLLELLRVVAACAVIWFHIESAGIFSPTQWGALAYSGLVFFLIVSVVLQRLSTRVLSDSDFLLKRARKLLIPWLAWGAIYGLLNVMKGKLPFPYTSGVFGHLFGGTWIGLWFLPFLFLGGIGVFYASKITSDWDSKVEMIVFTGIGILLLLVVYGLRSQYLAPAPWAQWAHALPSIPIAIAHAAALRSNSPRLLFFAQSLLLLVCALILRQDAHLAISYAGGTSVAALGFSLPARDIRFVPYFASLCLGVYLVHSIFISAFKGIDFLKSNEVIFLSSIIVASFAIIALLQRLPLVRKIV